MVVVFDDIQWAEATFLDLLEYLADWIRSAPVLFLCLARPELLEVRSGWMSTKPNARLGALDPLRDVEINRLIRNLSGGADFTGDTRIRIAELAEGNPLFVEETLRMLIDDGILRRVDGKWQVAGDLAGLAIPPTINALLTARLERLDPEERAVIERASIVGRVFSWKAVSLLSPNGAEAEGDPQSAVAYAQGADQTGLLGDRVETRFVFEKHKKGELLGEPIPEET